MILLEMHFLHTFNQLGNSTYLQDSCIATFLTIYTTIVIELLFTIGGNSSTKILCLFPKRVYKVIQNGRKTVMNVKLSEQENYSIHPFARFAL